MTRSEIDIVKGDRLDLKIGDKKCLSSILRIVAPDMYVIAAPKLRNIEVMAPLGELIRVAYYRGTGMFSFVAEVVSSYLEEDVPAFEIALRSPISKYQRRDFPRFKVELPFSMRVLAEERAEDAAGEDGFNPLKLAYDHRYVGKPRPPSDDMRVCRCKTADISGGGMKFFTDMELPKGTPVECTLPLPNGESFTADGEIVQSERSGDGFVTSMKYLNIDERVRRRLINYIRGEEQKGTPDIKIV